MTLFTIPLRYARVKWLRTGLLTAVFTLGVASMTGLWQVSELIGDSFERKLVSYGANILVTPQRDTLIVGYGGYTLGDVTLEEHWIDLEEARAGIDSMSLRGNIAVVAPKLLAAARVHERTVALLGVEWNEELTLKGFWEVEGAFPSSPDEVVAGSALAASLGVRTGESLNIGGRDFRVSGILQPTGGDDDAVLFLPLSFVQAFTGKPGQAAFLEIAALCAGCPIEDIVAELQQVMPGTDVTALRQVAKSRMYALHFVKNLAFYISLVILVTAFTMIIMSMLSAVAERRKEIGIMRAVGFSRLDVFTVFVSEALAIGLLSGVLGYTAGHVLAGLVLDRLQLEDVAALGLSFGPMIAVVALTAAIAGLAAAFPAWKASLVEPAEALVAV